MLSALLALMGLILAFTYSSSVSRFDARKQFIAESIAAQAILWPLTAGIAAAGKPGPVEVSLASAMTDVLDVHTERIAALIDKLPSVVIWMLVLIGASSMAVVGYNAAISGPVSRWRMMTFALVLTGVMLIIIDSDRPGDGLIRVNTVSIENTIVDMEAQMRR